ncbi:NAD(P)-binding protein [Peniophora sp. CONT]|nr:NAD(P)-binding protein [Peniophora sp. CONT]
MGVTLSLLSQSYPPKPKWTVDDIPDLSGKVIIVTGGNAGVGKETVKALLQHNAKVYLAARNPERVNSAIEELKTATGKEAIFLQLDLSDLIAVRKSAEEFLAKEQMLHVLINNAGVMACPMDQLTAQGYDMQLGTNVVGHYFFTTLLLPALEAAATNGEKARVVNVSSTAAYFASGLLFDSARDGPERRKHITWDMYNTSKLGNVLFARELARRYGDKIVSTSLNPGNLKTDLQRHLPGWQQTLINLILYPSPMGAITQLWAGTAPEAVDFNGKFLIPWARVGPTPAKAQDPALGEKLWTWLEEQCKDF